MPAPAAGYNPCVGTGGLVRAAALTINLSNGLIAVPAAEDLPATVAVAGINMWAVSPELASGTTVTFGNPVDARGVMWELELQGGIAKGTIEIEGDFDADSAGNSAGKFALGSFLILDLLLNHNSGFGYYGVVAKVLRCGPSTRTSQDPAAFRATLKISGVLPAPGYPS